MTACDGKSATSMHFFRICSSVLMDTRCSLNEQQENVRRSIAERCSYTSVLITHFHLLSSHPTCVRHDPHPLRVCDCVFPRWPQFAQIDLSFTFISSDVYLASLDRHAFILKCTRQQFNSIRLCISIFAPTHISKISSSE